MASSRSAFLALDTGAGTGVCWGHASYGGACTSVNFAGVTRVYSTWFLEGPREFLFVASVVRSLGGHIREATPCPMSTAVPFEQTSDQASKEGFLRGVVGPDSL